MAEMNPFFRCLVAGPSLRGLDDDIHALNLLVWPGLCKQQKIFAMTVVEPKNNGPHLNII